MILENYSGHAHQKFGHTSISQHGEDLYFMNLWKFLKLDKPTYLDLGAYHPVHISNTALLYLNGARGVNVEANSFLLDAFRALRPEDKNIWSGVGPRRGTFVFHMESNNSVLNSFKKESFAQHGVMPMNSVMVSMLTINDIVNEYCQGKFPDFLFTDLEDLDYEVLESADFSQSKPKVICSEIRQDLATPTKIMLNEKGFSFICRFAGNYIFVAKEYIHMCL